MLTIKLISEETDRVIKGLNKKHFPNAEEAIQKVLDIDKRRRETQQKLDANLSEAKKKAAMIGQLMKQGKTEEAGKVRPSATCTPPCRRDRLWHHGPGIGSGKPPTVQQCW